MTLAEFKTRSHKDVDEFFFHIEKLIDRYPSATDFNESDWFEMFSEYVENRRRKKK